MPPASELAEGNMESECQPDETGKNDRLSRDEYSTFISKLLREWNPQTYDDHGSDEVDRLSRLFQKTGELDHARDHRHRHREECKREPQVIQNVGHCRRDDREGDEGKEDQNRFYFLEH